ncbi:MAG TPA: hypothetical protein VGF92_20715 [Stellaceae bacterium]|jgi:hypothetical protein
MAWYRVYFLSRSGDIRNVDEFEADNDESAATFADQLHDALSDIYAGYEVWHLSRRVVLRISRDEPRPALCRALITERMQASLLRREETLHSSETAFSRSRLLLEKMRDLREIVKTRQHSHRGDSRQA